MFRAETRAASSLRDKIDVASLSDAALLSQRLDFAPAKRFEFPLI
jgi:hypothetical protein